MGHTHGQMTRSMIILNTARCSLWNLRGGYMGVHCTMRSSFYALEIFPINILGEILKKIFTPTPLGFFYPKLSFRREQPPPMLTS